MHTGSGGSRVRVALADGRRYTVAQLAAATSLARSTVVQVLAQLEREGTVRRHAARPVGRGRPAHQWSTTASPHTMVVLVAAAHGTTIGVVRADGQVLAAREAPPLDGDRRGRDAFRVPGLIDRVVRDASLERDDVGMAVVGLPGASNFSASGEHQPVRGRRPAPHLNRFRVWDGVDPALVIREHLRCPVYTENDANLAALGEVTHGAGRGQRAALYVSLAHGTGAGVVIGGRLFRGRSRMAGEIGHLHSEDDGRLCACGARGCFWQRRSFPALLEDLARAHGRRYTGRDVAAAAARDESDVVRALHGLGYALGRRLADAVVFLDPEVIILDGALGPASRGIAAGVEQALHRYAPPLMARACEVRAGYLGRHAPLVGGAALARTEQLLPTS